ncbi:MAG: B12-binding domain-containing radical SAM protein [Candidatus Rifleibacteriota bacterium]
MNRILNILLIQPGWKSHGYRRKIKVDENRIHPLTLGVVAACSSPHETTLIDEAIEPVPADLAKFDLVGISVNTYVAPKAFELADNLRNRGLKVVIGGVHAGLMPEECLQHADSVVIGYAEDTWPVLLQDFLDGNLKQRYESCWRNIEMASPRRDLFRNRTAKLAYCETTRGCHNSCRFCYLNCLPDKALVFKDIGKVHAELDTLSPDIVLFCDDNLFCNRDYAMEMISAITPLKKHWWIQAPSNIYNDAELIKNMSKSGCFSVSIGFQTGSDETNQAEQIYQNNSDRYKALVDLLHRHQVLVDGTFIFGFDSDSPTVFRRTEELIRKLGLDSYTFYFLTPYPGTQYMKQPGSDSLLLTSDWSDFDWDHVIINPKQMTSAELEKGVVKLYRRLDRLYYPVSLLKNWRVYTRFMKSPELMRFLTSIGWNYRTSPILPQDLL